MAGLRDRVAIAGIGYTELSRDSGVSTLTLASRAVLAALEDAGIPIPENGTYRLSEAETAMLSLCDGFGRKSWPANRYGRWHQLNGPYDLNFDYYPTWGADCRVFVVDAETAALLGPIRGQ